MLFAIAGIYALSQSSREVHPGPPPLLSGSVLRPEFITQSEGSIEAGTAFVVRIPGYDRNVLLSALHLVGTAGGMSRDVPAAEVPGEVEEVVLFDAFDDSRVFSTSAAIPIPTASLVRETTPGDVIAFWAERGEATSHALAKSSPRVGDPIWLSASLLSGSDAQLHRAVVVEVAGGTLYYNFDNQAVEIQATSGAPLLNGKGEAVGLNLGGGVFEGRKFGFGNGVENFWPALEKALGKSAH